MTLTTAVNLWILWIHCNLNGPDDSQAYSRLSESSVISLSSAPPGAAIVVMAGIA